MNVKISTIGRDFNEISEPKMNRLILPTLRDIKNRYLLNKQKKEKVDSAIYIKILKGFEEELLQSISKLRDKKKIEQKQNQDSTDFVLAKNDNPASNIEINKKFLYSKEYFIINFVLNEKIFQIKFKDYELIKKLIEEKKKNLEDMKRINKNSIKFLVYLKEKNRTIDHSHNQHLALLKFKEKEHEKLEKTFDKVMTKKKGRPKSVFLSKIFNRKK